jgi:LacI family transcriptional regulator
LTSKVTIVEVAKEAGVGPSTVSRVLNAQSVSDQKREAVLRAIKKLNYRPNLMARNLRTSVSKICGLVIPDICNSFFGQIAGGAGAVLEKQGYELIIANTGQKMEKQNEAIQTMVTRQVDGIMLCAIGGEGELANQINKDNCPIVIIDNKLKKMDELDSVMVDNVESAYSITEHLCMIGYKRFAIITGPLEQSSAAERLAGFRKALEDYNLELDEEMIREADFTIRGGREAARLLLEKKPDAIVAANNHLAIGAITEIRRSGFEVPDNIAVVGFDDTEVGELIDPPLTIMSQPAIEMGETAARLLLHRICSENETIPVQARVLPARLIVRSSCGFYRKLGNGLS